MKGEREMDEGGDMRRRGRERVKGREREMYRYKGE